MLIEKWLELDKSEQDKLASKYGITRRGLDNVTTEEELKKIVNILIPPPIVAIKPDVQPEIKTKKLGAKRTVKLGNKGKPVKKVTKR